MAFPGSELYWDEALSLPERWYCRVLGAPIIGLRIRWRHLSRLLPESANVVLDAGCGRGVISRLLAKRYPCGRIDAIDQNAAGQVINAEIARRSGLSNCNFLEGDLTKLDANTKYDLIISVDNLEHIEDDGNVLRRFYQALKEGGTLVVHVPHYYRRWPVFKWVRNFDVPGHVRPGYHLPELAERARNAGFTVSSSGFSYGILENLANNLSYAITAAEEKNRLLYAALFPLLNLLAWLGRGATTSMGAGVWLIARKQITLKK